MTLVLQLMTFWLFILYLHFFSFLHTLMSLSSMPWNSRRACLLSILGNPGELSMRLLPGTAFPSHSLPRSSLLPLCDSYQQDVIYSETILWFSVPFSFGYSFLCLCILFFGQFFQLFVFSRSQLNFFISTVAFLISERWLLISKYPLFRGCYAWFMFATSYFSKPTK